MLNFITPGPIDILALTTFGASIKDESAIGRKGTGFKYAAAIILRNGGSISVHSCDGNDYTFEARPEIIRGKDFQIIHCNGKSINATTETGKDWTCREAYRELASNTLDEGGDIRWGGFGRRRNHSVIRVECEGVEEWFGRHDEIFLNKTSMKKIIENNFIEVYDKPSSVVFFRGVAVGTIHPGCLYTYNLLGQLELTEDRTFKYEFQINDAICAVVQNYHSEFHAPFLSDWSHNQPKYRETSTQLYHPDEPLLDAIGEAIENNRVIPRNFRDAFYTNRKERAEELLGGQTPTSTQSTMIERSLKVLHAAGFNIDPTTVLISRTLGTEVLGQADFKRNRMYINEATFKLGTLQVCQTILEEYCHLESRAYDGSREFQEYLLNRLVNMAMEIAGEVL